MLTQKLPCGHAVDDATTTRSGFRSAGNGGPKPHAGAASVCALCGALGVYDARGLVRKPTSVEKMAMATDPEIQKWRNTVLARVDRGGGRRVEHGQRTGRLPGVFYWLVQPPEIGERMSLSEAVEDMKLAQRIEVAYDRETQEFDMVKLHEAGPHLADELVRLGWMEVRDGRGFLSPEGSAAADAINGRRMVDKVAHDHFKF